MNCKPGDLAIVVNPTNAVFSGKLVEVLCAAPSTEFRLPNGVIHLGCGAGGWVIKSLGRPFPGALDNGMYGVGSDSKLRPIRGADISETEDAALTVDV